MQTSTKVVVVCSGIWKAVTGVLSACPEHCCHTRNIFHGQWRRCACVCSISFVWLTCRAFVVVQPTTALHGAGRQHHATVPRAGAALLCHRPGNKRLLSSPNCSPWILCCYGRNSTGMLWHMQWARWHPHLLPQPAVLSGERTGTPGNSWGASASALSASSP